MLSSKGDGSFLSEEEKFELQVEGEFQFKRPVVVVPDRKSTPNRFLRETHTGDEYLPGGGLHNDVGKPPSFLMARLHCRPSFQISHVSAVDVPNATLCSGARL